MSTTTNGGQTPAVGQPLPAQLNVIAQYIKDFSFENPNAPRPMIEPTQQPAINVQINVNPRQLAATDYEVELLLEGGAGEGASVVFKFELHYAGVFRIENVPADQVQPLAMIEGPRLLFPFARQIIADAVRNGGYPPLYVDPIDFHRLYLQRQQAAAAAPANA